MFSVYILRLTNGQFYIGQTNDIKRRLGDHSNSNGAKYIKDNGAFRLVYNESFTTRKAAMQLEKQLKGWSHAKKEALIRHDFSKLMQLARGK